MLTDRPTDALVVVGMSIAEVDLRDDLRRAADGLGATLAFLQQGDPSLAAELTRLADGGAGTITLVGIATGPLAALAPAHSWLRRIAGHWWRERAGHRPQIDVATRLAGSVADLADARRAARAITGTEPGLTSAAWEDVSAHRHQVMVCRGPRCTAQGAEDNVRALVLAMLERGLGDEDVLLVHTGCQFPCNRAPVISVQPDDVWYGGVDPQGAAQIAGEHLAGDKPVERLRLPRTRGVTDAARPGS